MMEGKSAVPLVLRTPRANARPRRNLELSR